MSSSMSYVKQGKVFGKGAKFKVVLGFEPKVVELFNAAAGGLTSAFKTKLMDGEYAKKTVPAGTVTYANNMVEIVSDGFYVGADADLNASGEEIFYAAYESNHSD